MKKKIILSSLILPLILSCQNVLATEIPKDDIPNSTYIIGTYMFTPKSNEAFGYDGYLTTRDIMLAAKSISGTQKEDMIIYRKDTRGRWVDGLTGESLEPLDKFNILKIDYEDIENTPILANGIINNNYYGIKKNTFTPEAALNNSEGISAALYYASENNIKDIKLEKGTYYINPNTLERYYGELSDLSSSKTVVDGKIVNYKDSTSVEGGIWMQSNINFDLNESELKVYPNSNATYSIISFREVENSTISNGKITGDRLEHLYNYNHFQVYEKCKDNPDIACKFTSNDQHQSGHGISIRESHNIIIDNLEISETIGDGISLINNDISYEEKKLFLNNTKFNERSKLISNYNFNNLIGNDNKVINTLNNTNHDIKITNNKIHDIKRQGIAIPSGNDILISNNIIYSKIVEKDENDNKVVSKKCTDEILSAGGYDARSCYYFEPDGDDNYHNFQMMNKNHLGNAIDLERSNGNALYSNIIIENNQVYDISSNSIMVFSSAENLKIKNNELSRQIRFTRHRIQDSGFNTYKGIKQENMYYENDLESFKLNHNVEIINNTLINKNDERIKEKDYVLTDINQLVRFDKWITKLSINEDFINENNGQDITNSNTPLKMYIAKLKSDNVNHENQILADYNGSSTGKITTIVDTSKAEPMNETVTTRNVRWLSVHKDIVSECPTKTQYLCGNGIGKSMVIAVTTDNLEGLNTKGEFTPLAIYVNVVGKVTFDTKGGNAIPSQEVEYNQTLTKPTNPAKAGYTFKEWQLNGETFNFDSVFGYNKDIKSDITLTAVWE